MPVTDPGWNHNTIYHPLVLDAVRPGQVRALDVGCGEGRLTRELRRSVREVVGIDSDRASIELAQRHPMAGDIAYVEADVRTYPFEPASFDLIAAVATLHHMDAAAGLRRLDELLAPGGSLVVIGCARATPLDLPLGLAAVVAHQLRRARGPVWEHPSPTVWPPPETYGSMRRIATRLLPGADFCRRLYWRYSVTWVKPVAVG